MLSIVGNDPPLCHGSSNLPRRGDGQRTSLDRVAIKIIFKNSLAFDLSVRFIAHYLNQFTSIIVAGSPPTTLRANLIVINVFHLLAVLIEFDNSFSRVRVMATARATVFVI